MRISLSALSGQALLNSIMQPIYDTLYISTINAGEVYAFQTPAGQAGKTVVDTNLSLNGQLSVPDVFAVRGFCVEPLCRDVTAAGFLATGLSIQDLSDHRRFLAQTLFRFHVGSDGRKIIEVHPAQLPAGLGLQGMVTTGGLTAGANVAYITGNGVRQVNNRYSLGKDYAEVIRAGENFKATLLWPTTVNMSQPFSSRLSLPGIWMQGVG